MYCPGTYTTLTRSGCDENGDYPVKKNSFSRRMSEKGFVSSRMGQGGARGWRGVKLQDEFIDRGGLIIAKVTLFH